MPSIPKNAHCSYCGEVIEGPAPVTMYNRRFHDDECLEGYENNEGITQTENYSITNPNNVVGILYDAIDKMNDGLYDKAKEIISKLLSQITNSKT